MDAGCQVRVASVSVGHCQVRTIAQGNMLEPQEAPSRHLQNQLALARAGVTTELVFCFQEPLGKPRAESILLSTCGHSCPGLQILCRSTCQMYSLRRTGREGNRHKIFLPSKFISQCRLGMLPALLMHTARRSVGHPEPPEPRFTFRGHLRHAGPGRITLFFRFFRLAT